MFNLSLIMLLKLMIFICMKALTLLLQFSEQARGPPTWSVWATWWPRPPCWWPLVEKVMSGRT